MDSATLPHDSRGNVVIIAGIVTNSLATMAVCARLYTRYIITHQVGIDDWMAVASLLLTIGMNVSQSVNASRYLGRHIYDLDDLSVDIPRFLQLFWINELFYNAAMFFIKMTFLFQYYRVFRQTNSLRIAYLVTIFLIGGWCLGQFLSVVFICIPVQGFWDMGIKAKCQNQLIGVYLNAVGTLVTDFIILFLPMPAIWKLNLPKTQKWALLGIFGIGGFTSAISIVRVTTLGAPGGDLTYLAATSSCWSVAELSSGVIAASLATIRPLIGRFIPSFASKLNSASKPSRQYGDGPPTIGSSKRVSSVAMALGKLSRNNPRNLTSTSDADLFTHGEFELHESSTQRNPPDTRRSKSQETFNGMTRTPKSEIFNVTQEDDEGGLARIDRVASQRSSRYCYYESSSRDSEADLGLWPGTQTKVTGGLPTPPQLHEDIMTMKPKGLAIRVDRDWEVCETYA
ncbi:hypothetical protein HD806DRAFT_260251 [Xylariaceae sp. AK1471]|nr:hypothetical protein HD806DRAFT_260251 [Xylariaceae sp. AK1471]